MENEINSRFVVKPVVIFFDEIVCSKLYELNIFVHLLVGHDSITG